MQSQELLLRVKLSVDVLQRMMMMKKFQSFEAVIISNMYFEHLFCADPSIIESNIYEVNSTPSSHQGGFYDL